MRTAFEDRLTEWLIEDAPVDLPDRVLDTAFATTSATRQDRRPGTIPWPGRTHRLLVAAALLVGTVGVSVVVGALISRQNDLAPDLLERVRTAGVLRVAVRPDHPQLLTPSAGLDGFDIDVADEIGSRLGLAVEIVPIAAGTMLMPEQVDRWDVALPSVPQDTVDTGRFEPSVPYYSWPHFLLVPSSSAASSLQDLAGQPICAVQGDSGERWLAAQAAGGSRNDVIVRGSDDECLDALATGDVAGAVTARLGPADLDVRPAFRAIPGPPAEPRTIVAGLRQNPFTLIARIDEIVGELRGDGTLERLSGNRFGGADLTLPVDQ
jgi:ABC-type amino acid transport substrate-binding protein